MSRSHKTLKRFAYHRFVINKNRFTSSVCFKRGWPLPCNFIVFICFKSAIRFTGMIQWKKRWLLVLSEIMKRIKFHFSLSVKIIFKARWEACLSFLTFSHHLLSHSPSLTHLVAPLYLPHHHSHHYVALPRPRFSSPSTSPITLHLPVLKLNSYMHYTCLESTCRWRHRLRTRQGFGRRVARRSKRESPLAQGHSREGLCVLLAVPHGASKRNVSCRPRWSGRRRCRYQAVGEKWWTKKWRKKQIQQPGSQIDSQSTRKLPISSTNRSSSE